MTSALVMAVIGWLTWSVGTYWAHRWLHEAMRRGWYAGEGERAHHDGGPEAPFWTLLTPGITVLLLALAAPVLAPAGGAMLVCAVIDWEWHRRQHRHLARRHAAHHGVEDAEFGMLTNGWCDRVFGTRVKRDHGTE